MMRYLRWIEQSLLDVKSMAAETATNFFGIARGAADPPAKL
jgi:hypothetical protein